MRVTEYVCIFLAAAALIGIPLACATRPTGTELSFRVEEQKKMQGSWSVDPDPIRVQAVDPATGQPIAGDTKAHYAARPIQYEIIRRDLVVLAIDHDQQLAVPLYRELLEVVTNRVEVVQ